MQGFVALVAMLATQVLVSLASLVAPVLAPLAAKDFGVEPYLVGVYVSVMYGFASLSSLASGGTIARFGALRASQLSLAFSGAAMMLAAYGTVPVLLAAAILMGLGYGPTTPASSHILARTTQPRQMNLVFSLKQTGVPAGNALAGALVPAIALALGWRTASIVIGVACIALAWALQPLRESFDYDRNPARSLLRLEQLVQPFREVMRSPAIRLLALTSIAYAGMQVCLGTFLVTYLNHGLGLPLVTAGLMLSVAQIAGVVGRIAWGWLADRWAPPMIVLGALGVVASVCAVATGLFSANWPETAVTFVCALFGGTAIGWNGVFFAQIARAAPPERIGAVTGGTTFFTYGGVLIAPAIFSTILSATGSYPLGFAIAALFTGVSGIAFLRRAMSP